MKHLIFIVTIGIMPRLFCVKDKPVVIKRAVMIHDTTKPKSPRVLPWYVHNAINHKWAVIDSADVDNHHDTIWLFYGSMSRYNAQLEAQLGDATYWGHNYGYVNGKWGEIEDSVRVAPIGGEFQFSTLDSAKIYYNKFLKKLARDKFVQDSTQRRHDFVVDSIFKREHTYKMN